MSLFLNTQQAKINGVSNQSINAISTFVVFKNEVYPKVIASTCCIAREGIFKDNRISYAFMGLKKFKARYQSGKVAFFISNAFMKNNKATTIKRHNIVNKKKTSIALPIAVDLFLNKHDKKIPILKKTSPTSIVAPMNIRYST